MIMLRPSALAFVIEQALQRGRRAVERHSELLPHHRHRQVNRFDPAQHVRHEIALFEARRIAPIRHFIVGRSVDVVEDRARQPPHGKPSKVMEAVAIGEAHVDGT